MITITNLTDEILKAGLSFSIQSDLRGTFPGGPVTITVTRNSGPFTHLYIRTLKPLNSDPNSTADCFITNITIDEAAAKRIAKTMTAEELWSRIYNLRLRTIPPSEPVWQRRERCHQELQPISLRVKPPYSRYQQRPSKNLKALQALRTQNARYQ